MKKIVGLGIAAATFMIGTAASAQEVNKQGTLVISADRVIGYNSSVVSTETEDQNGQTTEVSNSDNRFSLLFGGGGENRVFNVPRLSIDFMLAEGVSLGGSIGVVIAGGETETKNGGRSTTVDAPSVFGFAIAPRAGYLYMFDEMLGIWPRAGFTFFSQSSERENDQNVKFETSRSGFDVNVEVPLVVAINDHAFFHVGPLVDIPLTGSQTVTETPPQGQGPPDVESDLSIFNIGLMAGIGGNL